MTNRVKPKILIIPSWYPTPNKPLDGIFFQEQALAMNHLYDIRIFYPERLQAGRLSRLFNTILFLLKVKPSIEFINDGFANEPEKYSFYYRGGISRLKLEEKMLECVCNAAYEKLIKTGWKPDLIHAHCTAFGGIISNFISKKHNIPYIITEHNIFLLHSSTKRIQGLIKLALENAKVVIAVSEHQKRMILMHNINCHPIVVGNMIDENIFKIKRKEDSIFTILHITYSNFIKDNETFFKAIQMFTQKTNRPIKVKVIVRSINAEQTKPFFSLQSEYNLTNFVEIIENVERDKIVAYFQNSDVLVSTSIAETFGVNVCEALFCGIPTVSTANGGIDDMISDTNGIKVNIQDENAICNALLKISNEEITFIPKEIRNSVMHKFSKDVFIRKIHAIYCTALNDATKL